MFGEVVEQRAEADRGRLEPGREEERPLQRWAKKYSTFARSPALGLMKPSWPTIRFLS